jgi:hypothetical protein
LLVVTTIIAAILTLSIWVYWGSVGYSDKIKHETDNWAVIKDSKGDVIAVETTDPVSGMIWLIFATTRLKCGLEALLKSTIAIGGFVSVQTLLW